MLLTFEYNAEAEALEIFCDQEGLDLLVDKLVKLKERGGHVHLRTPSWAGDELTEEKQVDTNRLVNHVRAALRPEGWQGATAQG